MYKVFLSPSSEKFIKNSEKELSKRIFERIEDLKENPFSPDCKRIEGYGGKVFRASVGKIRIIYEVLHEKIVLHIIKIDKRGKVYN